MIMKWRLIFDSNICKLNGIEFDKFCVELKEMNIPFRMDIINKLCNDSNKYGIGWKNRCLIVNRKEYKMISVVKDEY